MTTVKIYKNTSKSTLSVPGLGEIEAGQQISVTTEYHQPVIVENYPGLVEVKDEPVEEKPSEKV